jgi:hypothetical protein
MCPPDVSGILFASDSFTVIVVVDIPSAVILNRDATITDVEPSGIRGVNVTLAVWESVELLTDAVIVEVPVLSEEVNVMVYVPSPLSVTADSVPNVADTATASPPVVRLLPAASFSWTVITVVVCPFAAIDDCDVEMVEVLALAFPRTNDTTALSIIGLAVIDPEMVAVVTAVDEVNVAVYVPFPLSVIGVSDPADVFKITASPPVESMLPLLSLAWMVIIEVLTPLAMIVVGVAEITVVIGLAGPGKKFTVAVSVIDIPLSVPDSIAVPVVVCDVKIAV